MFEHGGVRFIGLDICRVRGKGGDADTGFGEVYYPSGAIYFVGRYDETSMDSDGIPYRLYAGTKFYEDGTPWQEGLFQWGGLYWGRIFYPSGKVKFVGRFNDKHGEITGCEPECYYGPSYPVEGTFYSERGDILYQGRFQIRKLGNAGYPQVIVPQNFGALR